MSFDERQLTEYSRYRAGITAHKITRVEDGVIYFERNKKGQIIEEHLQISAAEIINLAPGDYIDLQIFSHWQNGRETSYEIRYLGKTPEIFVPQKD